MSTGEHSTADTVRVLEEACRIAGVPFEGVGLIRSGENTIYRLSEQRVARIGRLGQIDVAAKEIRIARWLQLNNISAVSPLEEAQAQPIDVRGIPVTFWRELPKHRNGTPPEVATALRRLHALPRPTEFELGLLAPLARLDKRIQEAVTLSQDDRDWLQRRAEDLGNRYRILPDGLAYSAIHGDAWVGNVVVTAAGTTVLLDLERFSWGPPEWDLVSTAIKSSSFGWITDADYARFVENYGYDVTRWSGFEVLRDLRELRMTCHIAQQAALYPEWALEAQLRTDSLRGKRGDRPWPWTPFL